MSSDEKTRIQSDWPRATVGTQLSGIYELDEHLGSGGMAEVYRGHNIETGGLVAIKIVLPEFARDETILSLFRKEASILNHLSHDAIVRYHVFTIDPGIGRPYLAMEFVKGMPLSDVMRKGPMAAQDVRRLCLRLAAGLAAVHEEHVYHRDLSPDNIILPDGRVDRAKIIDFGIARSAHVGEGTLIGGRFAGKYSYVSPEQLGLHGGDVREQSDIYSLGLVLAAALRGRPLDMSGSQWEVIEKRRTVPALDGVDPDMAPMIEAMLQPDPRDRPATMEEVIALVRGGLAPDGISTQKPATPSAPWNAGLAGDGGDDMPAWLRGDPSTPPQSSADRAKSRLPATGKQPSFVEHVSPRLSDGRKSRANHTARSRLPLVLGAGALAAFLVAGTIYMVGVPWGGPDETAGLDTAAPQQPIDEAEPEVVPEPPAEPEPPVQPIDTQATDEPVDASPADQPADTTPQVPLPEATEDETPDEPGEPQDLAIIERLLEQSDAAGEVEPDPAPPVDPVRVEPDEVPQQALGARERWLQDYSGGPCFHAVLISPSETKPEIEGFGISVEPFEAMLADFQATFGVEPDVFVRPISAAQCPVTDLLAGLATASAAAPALSLDQTTVTDGAVLTGSVDFGDADGGLLMIDGRGMVSRLEGEPAAAPGRRSFSVPVDGSAGAPQLVVAIAGRDVAASLPLRPEPAAGALPRILDDIRAGGSPGAATAKYFRVGG